MQLFKSGSAPSLLIFGCRIWYWSL